MQADTFPRRHGAIVQRLAFLGPRKVTVGGLITKDDEATLKSYLNTLSGILTDRGRDRLTRLDDGRYLNAIKTNFSYRFSAGQAPTRRAAYSIEFLCDDPFWYDSASSSLLQLGVVTSPYLHAVTNSGGTKTPPLIEVKAGASAVTDVKITCTTTGIWFRYSGTINAGSTLAVDCADLTAICNGTNVLNLITGQIDMQLEPGLNNIVYEGPTTGIDLNVVWFQRYV